MGDWSKLPRDLIFLIADLLTSHHDFGSVRCVCNHWRQAIAAVEFFTKEQHLTKPSLMLVSNQTDQRMLYFPSRDLIFNHAELPSFKDKYCLSSRGCLIMHSEDLTISLVNPATGATISLPHMNTISNSEEEFMSIPLLNVSKVALSSNPFKNPEQDCSLLIIYGHIGKLAFVRLGDSAWTFVDVEEPGSIYDVIWYNERFYAINSSSTVFSVYISRESVIKITKINRLESQPTPEYPDVWYLVEFNKMLLAVVRYNAAGICFQAFAIDVDTSKVLEIKDIGEGACFLGFNSSEYIKASKTVRANSIYFNDHVLENWIDNGETISHISVFSFQDGINKPYLEKELFYYNTPAIWIITRD